MKKTLDILLTAIILILAGCQDKPSLDPVTGPSESHPIQFGISADLEVESKSVIDNDNVTDYGFLAFGNLTVDGVQQTDLFGPTGATVLYDDEAEDWTYSPLRYWQTGSYEFAAVMPYLTAFTPSFSADNQLTLDFGTNGFNLAANQADLMVAFDSQTVQNASSATPVDFNFAHQLALLTIEGASKDPNTTGIQVDAIKVYGNSARTDGNMVFTNNQGTIIPAFTVSGSKTNSDEPFKTFLADDEAGEALTHDWTLVAPTTDGTPVYDVLIPELIVFPETCSFTIVVSYTENGSPKTMTGTLPATWEAGKKYTYRFHLASDISFSVEVARWGTPIKVGGENIPIL